MKHLVTYTPIDYTRPFTAVRPEEIDIYFYYDRRIGAATCKATCDHCYFRSRALSNVSIERALNITRSLRTLGYRISMASADSFGDDALRAGDAGSAYRLQAVDSLAWTSGVHLSLPGWEQRLGRAWEIGFRSIVLNAHDAAGVAIPFSGVTNATVIQRCIANIRTWNKEHELDMKFSCAVTFTIRRDICTLEHMRTMVAWAVREQVDLIRFNCFSNFLRQPAYAQYEMTRDDIIRFFGYLAILQEEFMTVSTALGFSGDFGDAGIERVQRYLPSEWQRKGAGWCGAGYRLFALVEVENELLLVGCVDKLEPQVGKVLVDHGEYRVVWDYERIELIRRAVIEKTVYACWGGVGSSRSAQDGFKIDRTVEDVIFHSVSSRKEKD